MRNKLVISGFLFLLVILMGIVGFGAIKYLPKTKSYDNTVYERKIDNKEEFLSFLLENYSEKDSTFRLKSDSNNKIIYELVNDNTKKVVKEFIYDLKKNIWIIREKTLYFRLL